jgi:hypothetical protein
MNLKEEKHALLSIQPHAPALKRHQPPFTYRLFPINNILYAMSASMILIVVGFYQGPNVIKIVHCILLAILFSQQYSQLGRLTY